MGPYTIYFCFGALAVAALLSWYHNYARVLCLAIATGIAVWSFAGLSYGPQLSNSISAVLLPLNFVLFAWLVERGVLTLSGLLKLGVIGFLSRVPVGRAGLSRRHDCQACAPRKQHGGQFPHRNSLAFLSNAIRPARLPHQPCNHAIPINTTKSIEYKRV
jgi:hypothetical protein